MRLSRETVIAFNRLLKFNNCDTDDRRLWDMSSLVKKIY